MNEKKLNYLLNWDKKHRDYLIEFYAKESNKTNFIHELFEYSISNPNLLNASTWLIKHHIENKNQIDINQKDEIIKLLDFTSEWESQLHIYQIIPKLKLEISNAIYLEPIIYKDLFSDNKFLKAAAFESYFEIIKLLPDLKNEFINICQSSLELESAAVKVKIKRILKQI